MIALDEKLYDHYKETNELNRQAQKARDKSFLWVCLTLLVQFLLAAYPNETFGMLTEGVKESVGVNINIGINVIQSFFWLLLLWLMMRYFQKVVYIERQYHYVQKLEEKLGISREGDDYLENYPALLNIIHWIYQYFFPIALGILLAIRIIWECCQPQHWPFKLFDSFACILCLVLLIAYWVFIRRNQGTSKKQAK